MSVAFMWVFILLDNKNEGYNCVDNIILPYNYNRYKNKACVTKATRNSTLHYKNIMNFNVTCTGY